MKNFVVVEHRTKSDNKSELVAFEKKVDAVHQKGYFLVGANSIYDQNKERAIHYAYLVKRR